MARQSVTSNQINMYTCFCLSLIVVICCTFFSSCCCLKQTNDSEYVGGESSNIRVAHQTELAQKITSNSSSQQLARFRRKSRNVSEAPEFSAPIGNVTAVQGRDVRLVCTVEHLGQHQVAWLKEETKTILSIDTNIITTNYRIFLIPDEEERKWVLHIKDVQSSDRGFYQCQVNTVPMRSTSGYLEVVVPPTIIESQSSQVADVTEHANVSIQCKANGYPRASISWRRDDGLPIRLNGKFNQSAGQSTVVKQLDQTGASQEFEDVKSDKLSLYDVDRTMAAIYVCTASNGIPSQASKRIPLYVKFPPKVSINNKYVSVSLGDQLEIDCIIEASPKANSYWSKKPSSGGASNFERRGGLSSSSSASKWYQLMMANDVNKDVKRGALFVPSKEVVNQKTANLDGQQWFPSNSSTSSSASIKSIVTDNDIDEDSDYLAKAAFSNATKTGAKHPSGQLIRTSAQYNHHHNRIQFRQAVEQSGIAAAGIDRDDHLDRFAFAAADINGGPLRRSFESGSSSSSSAPEPINESLVHGAGSNNNNKAYLTVQQSAINSFTYKLRLSVAQMQPEDYGQYSCISSNSLGSSEATVVVTRADRATGRSRNQPSDADIRSNEEKDYQHDSLNSDATGYHKQQQVGTSRRGPIGNQVYDENYLQAIKARQNNLFGPNNSQQKLKLRQSSDRSGTLSTRQSHGPISITISLILINLAAIYSYGRVSGVRLQIL